jgi:hypothetical protein
VSGADGKLLTEIGKYSSRFPVRATTAGRAMAWLADSIPILDKRFDLRRECRLGGSCKFLFGMAL